MDDQTIYQTLIDAMGAPEDFDIDVEAIREIKKAPISYFDALEPQEKTIALTAFVAAAGAAQNRIAGELSDAEVFDVYRTPSLDVDLTRSGLMAAAAALSRIPMDERSAFVTDILDDCGCSPNPRKPHGDT